jgi:hypothetical protein
MIISIFLIIIKQQQAIFSKIIHSIIIKQQQAIFFNNY